MLFKGYFLTRMNRGSLRSRGSTPLPASGCQDKASRLYFSNSYSGPFSKCNASNSTSGYPSIFSDVTTAFWFWEVFLANGFSLLKHGACVRGRNPQPWNPDFSVHTKLHMWFSIMAGPICSSEVFFSFLNLDYIIRTASKHPIAVWNMRYLPAKHERRREHAVIYSLQS